MFGKEKRLSRWLKNIKKKKEHRIVECYKSHETTGFITNKAYSISLNIVDKTEKCPVDLATLKSPRV